MIFQRRPVGHRVRNIVRVRKGAVTEDIDIPLTHIEFCHVLMKRIACPCVKSHIDHRHSDLFFDQGRIEAESHIRISQKYNLRLFDGFHPFNFVDQGGIIAFVVLGQYVIDVSGNQDDE